MDPPQNHDQAELPSLRSLLQLKKKYDAPTVDQLPETYRINSDKERLYVWAAKNFERQVRHHFPSLQPLCLVCKNECNVEKLISTFVKPTVLPYSHLFDIDACASFVSDYVCYQSPPGGTMTDSVCSPTFTLATQLGNSVEMSNLLVSLLTGFGFRTFVVCGWVQRKVAEMDRTTEPCNLVTIAQEDAVKTEMEEPSHKYEIREPPLLISRYCDFVEKLQQNGGKTAANSLTPSDNGDGGGRLEDRRRSSSMIAKDDEKTKSYFHAWVYVQVSDVAFFIETTTGERKALDHPDYLKINSVWNQENYWLSKNDGWKSSGKLDLNCEDKWIKFVGDGAGAERDKRLLVPLQSWVGELRVPKDCYELLYRLGQKSEIYSKVKVEYFAPYLLKEGTVQRVNYLVDNSQDSQAHILERFRHRADKMSTRETFSDRNIETFLPGRGDNLKTHEHVRLSSVHPTEYISNFYSEARSDGLVTRVCKDLELTEHYVGRVDGLRSTKVTFVIGEKKFGPADSATRGNKEISKIVEKFEEVGINGCEGGDFNPGRVLNTARVMERAFDIENERISLKFQREGGQLFCKTVEFLVPRLNEEGKRPYLSLDDVKVYMVDPREESPCLRELNLILAEQTTLQELALQRVVKTEKEMNKLLEDRMKELSANEMEVWRYDVKRNAHVKKGRLDHEKREKDREKQILDLELDLLAPYFERYSNAEALTKTQTIALRDECLANIRSELNEKEREMKEQLARMKEEVESRVDVLAPEDVNSKKFLINVLETRLSRRMKNSQQFYVNAEKKICSDRRVLKFIQ